jgi:hypothetical protein
MSFFEMTSRSENSGFSMSGSVPMPIHDVPFHRAIRPEPLYWPPAAHTFVVESAATAETNDMSGAEWTVHAAPSHRSTSGEGTSAPE